LLVFGCWESIIGNWHPIAQLLGKNDRKRQKSKSIYEARAHTELVLFVIYTLGTAAFSRSLRRCCVRVYLLRRFAKKTSTRRDGFGFWTDIRRSETRHLPGFERGLFHHVARFRKVAAAWTGVCFFKHAKVTRTQYTNEVTGAEDGSPHGDGKI